MSGYHSTRFRWIPKDLSVSKKECTIELLNMSHSFVRNTALTLMTRVGNILFGLVISILLARELGPNDRGIYALATLVPSLAILFVGAGLSSATVYLLGKKKYAPGLIAGNNIMLNLGLGAIGIIMTMLMFLAFRQRFFLDVPIYSFVAVVAALPFMLYNSNEVAIAQGLQRFSLYNGLTSVQVFVQFTILGGLFLTRSLTLPAAMVSFFGSTFINSVILSVATKKIVGQYSFLLDRGYVKESLSFGVRAQLSNVVAFLHLRIDQLILAVMTNPATVGFYAVATGLTERLWLLSESVSVIHYSRMSAEVDEAQRRRLTPVLTRNIMWLTIVGAGILALLSKWFITWFYSSRFLPVLLPFNILLLGTIFVSGARILANDITARGLPMVNTRVNSISVVMNIVLNLIFIPFYGMAGAAAASTISYSLLFLFRARAYARLSGNRLRDLLVIRSSDFHLYRQLFRQMKNRLLPVQSMPE
ncbi:MAG: flippase [Candidatus Kerfeldbacteria bacterium]|nr:flippase [Candidatus Kerfeldbacteria bacterium]